MPLTPATCASPSSAGRGRRAEAAAGGRPVFRGGGAPARPGEEVRCRPLCVCRPWGDAGLWRRPPGHLWLERQMRRDVSARFLWSVNMCRDVRSPGNDVDGHAALPACSTQTASRPPGPCLPAAQPPHRRCASTMQTSPRFPCPAATTSRRLLLGNRSTRQTSSPRSAGEAPGGCRRRGPGLPRPASPTALCVGPRQPPTVSAPRPLLQLLWRAASRLYSGLRLDCHAGGWRGGRSRGPAAAAHLLRALRCLRPCLSSNHRLAGSVSDTHALPSLPTSLPVSCQVSVQALYYLLQGPKRMFGLAFAMCVPPECCCALALLLVIGAAESAPACCWLCTPTAPCMHAPLLRPLLQL